MPNNARANSDIAIRQGARTRGDDLLLGGANSLVPFAFTYQDLRGALASGGSPNYVGWWDDFLGDTVNTTYAPSLSTGASAAIVAAAGGTVVLATSTTDENFATLVLGLNYGLATGGLIFEARVACVSATTSRSVEIGVSDALTESTGEAFSSHDATIVAVADDAAVFAMNSEESVTSYKALSVKAAGTPQGTVLSPAVAVTTAAQTFRIMLDTTGKAYYYVGGTLLATHANAVGTTSVLTPWITVTTQTTGDRQISVDYLLIAAMR